ncbi:MAG: hypothetical protein GF310_03405, partial [candidate division Zixibacteria bacterium]|nr:hypothetical protein [candidate division Zixibacteria bacterium]
IKTIILPEANKKDIDDIPDELKKKLTYKFVKTIDEAIKLILEPAKKKRGKKK